MASAPAVIGLVRKFAGDQFADHVADCLIPLDGAYARARQGAIIVTDPSENIVTSPFWPGACLPATVVNQYVEAEVRLPAFARIYIYQAASGDLEM